MQPWVWLVEIYQVFITIVKTSRLSWSIQVHFFFFFFYIFFNVYGTAISWSARQLFAATIQFSVSKTEHSPIVLRQIVFLPSQSSFKIYSAWGISFFFSTTELGVLPCLPWRLRSECWMDEFYFWGLFCLWVLETAVQQCHWIEWRKTVRWNYVINCITMNW